MPRNTLVALRPTIDGTRYMKRSTLVTIIGLSALGLLTQPGQATLPYGSIAEKQHQADGRVRQVQDTECALTRTQALAVLVSRGLTPLTAKLPIGDRVNIGLIVKSAKTVDLMRGGNNGAFIDAAYGAASALNLLQFRRQRLGAYHIEPTSAALNHGTVSNESYLGYSRVYTLQVTDRIPIEVTGLRDRRDCSYDVEFRYQLDNENEVFRHMLPQGTDAVADAHAVLAKYDDGWRVVEVKLGGL